MQGGNSSAKIIGFSGASCPEHNFAAAHERPSARGLVIFWAKTKPKWLILLKEADVTIGLDVNSCYSAKLAIG
ncbi:MAG: hypothetical protein K2Q11_01835 [Burkholderiaceae bacterium]|nr:hypothetical protein [Burkholderiaceae bacterium]